MELYQFQSLQNAIELQEVTDCLSFVSPIRSHRDLLLELIKLFVQICDSLLLFGDSSKAQGLLQITDLVCYGFHLSLLLKRRFLKELVLLLERLVQAIQL